MNLNQQDIELSLIQGGHEVQIHPSGDSARFKFYGGQPTDWMEIEFDENGAAYVETERGKELLADYMRYQ